MDSLYIQFYIVPIIIIVQSIKCDTKLWGWIIHIAYEVYTDTYSSLNLLAT